jgi:molybdopterin/thiamine biosynthesis adenylyltransferase
MGASVAVLLAQAGVGAFVLVDAENLTAPNTSRHPLGARSIGLNKASELATKLKGDFPLIDSVTALPRRWEQLSEGDRQEVGACHLILCAIGNTGVELALNDWAHTLNPRRPVIYGWLEPFACAVHAVAIVGGGGCLECGFDAAGRPLITVTEWPQGDTTRREPGCATTFQPYGSVELSAGVSAVAELALDVLVATPTVSTHRVKVTRECKLRGNGGRWSKAWTALIDRAEGDFSFTREWRASTSCARCNRSARTA